MKQKYAINKTKYLLEPEIAALNQTLTKFQDSDPRNAALLWILIHTGARATEALNIRAEDVNMHDKTVFIRGIKGSNDREIPLPDWLFKLVAKLAAKPGPIFDISYNRLFQIWELYRPCHKKLHSLRHTFAIDLYKRSKDIRLVQVALGHRNITNTMVYADYLYSQAELRKMLVA